MTTPESGPGSDAANDTGAPGSADHLRRPELERSEPRRNIFNAFRQDDGRGKAPRTGARFADDDIWTAGGHRVNGSKEWGSETSWFEAAQDFDGEAKSWDPSPLWESVSESVKAAYDVIDSQIREGQAAANRLNSSGDILKMRNLPNILNRLVQTYSDLGAVWIELLTAATEGDLAGRPAAKGQAAAPQASALAVEVTAAMPVTARARLYRPVGAALRVLPLRGVGADAGEIAGVSAAPGPTIRIEVPAGAAPGEYHGIVLEEGSDEPAGSVTVRVGS